MDANNQALVLAWAIVEVRNLSSWNYFLCHLRKANPGVNHSDAIMISDGEKELENNIT